MCRNRATRTRPASRLILRAGNPMNESSWSPGSCFSVRRNVSPFFIQASPLKPPDARYQATDGSLKNRRKPSPFLRKNGVRVLNTKRRRGASSHLSSVIMRRFSARREQELALAENLQPKTHRRRKIGKKMILLLIEHRDEGSPCRAPWAIPVCPGDYSPGIPVHRTADGRIATTDATSKSPR